MNFNKVFIIGNLTRDPETRSLPSGQPVASFAVATNRFWTKNGRQEKQTEFHNVVAFGKSAEIASQYLSRGKSVMVEGRLQTRNWEGKDGLKRNRTEIVVERLQLGPRLGGGGGGSPQGQGAGREEAPESQQAAPKAEEIGTIEYPPDEDINPDEIPF
ncbi:MAG: single-stranded DNA-binding protein [Patescibacteria group bacterium]